MGTYIATTQRAGFNALKYQGILVNENYRQIVATLRRNLSAEHAAIFAQPFASGDGTDWYSDAQGPVLAWSQAPDDKKNSILQTLQRLAQDIAGLAERLKSGSDGPSVTRGHILSMALLYPALDNIYVVGEQPVITCWGMVPARAGAQPQSLVRSGAAQEKTTATPEKAAQAAAPAAAPVAANLSEYLGKERKWPGWLKMLLPLTAALLLTMLLLYLLGHVPGCAGLSPDQDSPSAAAIEQIPANPPASPETMREPSGPELEELLRREGQLRQRLEDLRQQLILRAAQCPRQEVKPEQPQTPQEPEQPPLAMNELLPQSEPEPEPKPEVKPQPKPEVKPQPKPEPKPEAKPEPKPEPKPTPRSGDKMVIPPDAARNNDLSFLQGCWRASNTNCNNRPITEEYCFDGKGSGTRTIYDHSNNRSYRGPLRARFDSQGRLVLDISRAQNPLGNDAYNPEAVTCTQQGGNMRCDGRVIGEGCRYAATYYRK